MSIDELREAAARLAERLKFRAARHATEALDPEMPSWWREALAEHRIFGHGLLSLPTPGGGFSRPIRLLSAAEIGRLSSPSTDPFIPVAMATATAEWTEVLICVEGREPFPVHTSDHEDENPGQRLADSLVEFLDALVPCTLCDLGNGDEHRRIELIGDRLLLIDHGDRIEERRFSSDQDTASHVANFLADTIGAGYHVISCPADMVALIESYAGVVARSRHIPADERARVAIERLHRSGALELVVQDQDPETVTDALEVLIDQAGRFLDRHGHAFSITGRPSLALARRFGNWLLERSAVEEVYADDDALADAFLWDLE